MRYKMYDGTIVEVDELLAYCPNGQCGVRFDEHGAMHLVSYNTTVITVDPEGWLTCSGTYSATSRKHIGAYLKEYFPYISYHVVKRCYEDNKTLNVHTMEVENLS